MNGNSPDQFNPEEYWQKRLENDFNLKGVGFSSLGKAFNKWMYRVRRRQFLRILRNLRRDFSSDVVLDIGSGTGYYIKRWKELKVQSITGADITDVAVENLRVIYQHNFYKVDISDENISPLQEQSYTMISCMDVLFHIVDDDRYIQALENIYHLLKSEGFFIFSENFIHSEAIHHQHHVSRPLKMIEDQLKEVGFEIVCRVPMFYLMNAPVNSNSRLHHAIWHRFSQLISRRSILGYFFGMCLFPFELLLVTFAKESPTTEIMICVKS